MSREAFRERYGDTPKKDDLTLLLPRSDDPTQQIFVFLPEETKVRARGPLHDAGWRQLCGTRAECHLVQSQQGVCHDIERLLRGRASRRLRRTLSR